MTRLRFIGVGLVRATAGGFLRLAGWLLGVGGPMLLNGLVRLAPFLLRGLGLAFGVLTGPVGWAILAASAISLAYAYRDKIAEGWHAVTDWFRNTAWPMVRDTILSIDWSSIGMAIADKLTFGLASRLPAMGAAIKGAVADFGTALPGTRGANIKPVPFGAVPPKVPGRAGGGSVSGGRPYVVGERGPELMVPGRSGTVIPAHEVAAYRARRESGGSVYNVTLHVNGAQDPQAVAREVDKRLRRLAQGNAALLGD